MEGMQSKKIWCVAKQSESIEENICSLEQTPPPITTDDVT